jgi:hypothetical protein
MLQEINRLRGIVREYGKMEEHLQSTLRVYWESGATEVVRNIASHIASVIGYELPKMN